MLTSEEDMQSVGYTDMREWRVWLSRVSLPLRMLAICYPPSVYRLTLASGEVGPRVFPVDYSMEHGKVTITVHAVTALNPDLPQLVPHRITGVEPGALTPIKWPPDARVH